MKGHKNTVDLLTFSRNQKYIVSVSNTDATLFIWENGKRVSQNRVAKNISKVIFDE